ncbi:hypothetical protein [Kordiimonas aestuarii]|uniref:hypothetical protein n=1 Tax=Kordiimonas aestuarii TaxID=1005925 RepID=UPI0021D28A5D|nr:hypothetical protein [Kordiimonas aestuarii]
MQADALKPRIGFLVVAGILCLGAIGVYLFEDLLVGSRGEGSIAFAFVLGFLVLSTLVFILFYRVPRMGNRLLGFDSVLKKQRKTEKSSMSYTGSFHVETGLAEKRQNTQRKTARHSRRHYAEVTRQMKAEKARPNTQNNDEE